MRTLRAHYSASQAWPGCVAGLALPCRCIHARAGAQCRRPCAGRHVASRVLRAVSHTMSSRRAPCCVPPASYRGAPCAVSWCLPRPCHACLAIQPSGQAVRLSRYAHSYRDTIPQHPGPRVPAVQLARKLAVSRPVSAVSWPCPRPYHGPCCLSMRACYPPCVTIQCIVL